MSDAVIIAIVSGAVTLMTAAMTVYMNIKLTRIHKQMNSMQDKLVLATKQEATLEGNKQGRAELKEEMKRK